MNRIII